MPPENRATRDVTDLKSAPRSVPPVVLDVRWALGDSDGRLHYRDAHIRRRPHPRRHQPSDQRQPRLGRAIPVGVKPQVRAYCGSGITAAHQVAALPSPE